MKNSSCTSWKRNAFVGKCKSKAVPLQARRGPEGSRKLRSPDFVTTAQVGGRLSALRTGRLYSRKYSWYSFLLETESASGPKCDRKDFMSMKNSSCTSWNRNAFVGKCKGKAVPLQARRSPEVSKN